MISPIRALFSINLIKYRRALGLLAFLYALSHFVVWILFDIQLLWGELIKDVIKRPFISFGFLSLLGLLPLAITSNFISIKKLGIVNWQRLHVLVYPAGFFAGTHYVMVKKVWEGEALIYLIMILGLFAVRFVIWRKRVASQINKANKVSKTNL
jgi:sulfoxide reductase heme-binding subunit YedZ